MASGLDFSLPAGIDNYCVMGNPVAHSKSPQIHTAFARQCGQHLCYQSVLIPFGCFSEALAKFQQQGGRGLNITVPFKGDAWASVMHRTQRAEVAGAVNTIWFDERGDSYGDTTDGAGLVNDLCENDIQLRDKRILILGAGGAVRGVMGALLEQGVKSVTLANRTMAPAQALATTYAADSKIQACDYSRLQAGSVDIIINGTSASLQGELPPLPQGIAKGTRCYDMVYADTDTVFVTWAKDNGASLAIDGLGMLVQQAAESFYIWRGIRPDPMPVIAALRDKR